MDNRRREKQVLEQCDDDEEKADLKYLNVLLRNLADLEFSVHDINVRLRGWTKGLECLDSFRVDVSELIGRLDLLVCRGNFIRLNSRLCGLI